MPAPVVRVLRRDDDRSALHCGVIVIDNFLARYALQNQEKFRLSMTYVAEVGGRIGGFVTVSAGQIEPYEVPGARRFPRYSLPVLVIARMGTDLILKGQHVGTPLVLRAFQLAAKMASEIGCVGVFLHAKAKSYSYWRQQWGFAPLAAAEAQQSFVFPDEEQPAPLFLDIRRIEGWLREVPPEPAI